MATPELTYGGFPLATDVDQVVADFVDRHLSLNDLRDVVPSIARIGSRADGLAWPNYPATPRIRPNQLYWPTGAARWAIGYFFADDVSKKKIVAEAHPDSSTNTALELRVVQNQTFTANLFLLTPRKVSCVEGGNIVWLLPLVDERYFWQFQDIGDFGVTTASTWANMFSQLSSQLGVSISSDTAASNYLIPDPEELTRRFDNAGTLLDAVAHSIGQRIVRWPDGTIKSMNWSTSAAQLVDNVESKTPWQQIAGGELDFGPVPASVNVVCRRFVDHVAIPRKVNTFTEAASAHLTSPATTSGTVKTIHTTAYADFTVAGSGTPDNNTALDNLAEEIASDFYDSTLSAYDRTFVGIKLWDTSGYDDHVLYQFGGEYPKPNAAGEYDKWTHTRVQSSPVNFGVEHQLSQDPRTGTLATVLKPNQFGKLAEQLTQSGTATFDIWENSTPETRSGTSHIVTSPLVTVTAYNFPGTAVNSGTSTWIYFDFESERWYPDVTTPPASDSGPGGTGSGDANGTIWFGTVQPDTEGPSAGSAWTLDVKEGIPGYDTVAVKRGGVGSNITIRLPHIGIDGSRVGPAPNLAAGNIIGCSFVIAGEPFAGTHDGGDNQAVLSDASFAWATDEFVGWTIINQTKGESAIVTANTSTTVTGVLSGGADWDDGDGFQLLDTSATAVCVTGYLDDALGMIKMWDGTAADIPFGWQRIVGMNAFMPVGIDETLDGSDTTKPTINSPGTTDPGQWQHDHPDLLHDPLVHADSSGNDFDNDDPPNGKYNDHIIDDHDVVDADHWPPLYPLFFIRRFQE